MTPPASSTGTIPRAALQATEDPTTLENPISKQGPLRPHWVPGMLACWGSSSKRRVGLPRPYPRACNLGLGWGGGLVVSRPDVALGPGPQ